MFWSAFWNFQWWFMHFKIYHAILFPGTMWNFYYVFKKVLNLYLLFIYTSICFFAWHICMIIITDINVHYLVLRQFKISMIYNTLKYIMLHIPLCTRSTTRKFHYVCEKHVKCICFFTFTFDIYIHPHVFCTAHSYDYQIKT